MVSAVAAAGEAVPGGPALGREAFGLTGCLPWGRRMGWNRRAAGRGGAVRQLAKEGTRKPVVLPTRIYGLPRGRIISAVVGLLLLGKLGRCSRACVYIEEVCVERHGTPCGGGRPCHCAL